MHLNHKYDGNYHFVVVPAILLALFACAILLLDTWIIPNPKNRKYLLLVFVFPGLAFSGFQLWRLQMFLSATGANEITAFHGSITMDGFALFFNWIFLISSLIVAVVSYKYMDVEGEHHGEYYALLLLAPCGMFFLPTRTDLVPLFIGFALMA